MRRAADLSDATDSEEKPLRTNMLDIYNAVPHPTTITFQHLVIIYFTGFSGYFL